MQLFASLFSLLAISVSVASSPTTNGREARHVQHRANEFARAPVPIPTIANMDAATVELFKRDNQAEKIWTFGGYKTKKNGTAAVSMKAEFNETAGSSWCNEISAVGSGSARENVITSAHVDSHVGYPNPADRPPEYVCFFYESRGKCDPKDGHAEYIESVPGPKGSANETTFDSGKYKYISWGCQWHPKNMVCETKDHTGHPPGKKCP